MRYLVTIVSLAMAGCVVKPIEPAQPAPASEPVAAAEQAPPNNENVPASRPAPAAPATPPVTETVPAGRPTAPPAPPAARPNENVPASRPGAPTAPPAPPAARPNENVPASRPGAPTAPPAPPATRPNENVPSRRPVNRPFSIEPTAGPVGTTVTIYGDFSVGKSPGEFRVQFNSAKSHPPKTVAADRITVVVPPRATTGPVRVTFRRKVLFTGEFGVTAKDDGLLDPTGAGEGLLGLVYQLPPQTKRLPNFGAIGAPFATITVPNLKVTARKFDAGFPGLKAGGANLLEWFAIRFEGALMVPKAGAYSFRVNSDDGSKLYIDGVLVVDNDGVHAPRAKDSAAVTLTAGRHDVVIEYFQGPRFQIALELQWMQPNQKKFDTIAPRFFKR